VSEIEGFIIICKRTIQEIGQPRREEADRLIEALPGHMKPIVEFALATRCRAGEILGLEWSRVDLDRKVAWLDMGRRSRVTVAAFP
jgi:integrase